MKGYDDGYIAAQRNAATRIYHLSLAKALSAEELREVCAEVAGKMRKLANGRARRLMVHL